MHNRQQHHDNLFITSWPANLLNKCLIDAQLPCLIVTVKFLNTNMSGSRKVQDGKVINIIEFAI